MAEIPLFCLRGCQAYGATELPDLLQALTIEAMSRYAVGFKALMASSTLLASGPSWHHDSLWSATVFARERVTKPCSIGVPISCTL